VIALFQSAQSIQNFMESKGWTFCFIGGIAIQRWGEPRLTTDIDISLLTRFVSEEHYIDEFCEFLRPRVDNHKAFALRNRVLLLKTQSEIGVDIALAGIPYEEEVIQRASHFRFLDNVHLHTCSAEDLIVMKAFAERDRDWADVRTILIRQQDKLNWDIIYDHLRPLVEIKESPEILTKLEQMKNELSE
jgi:hypothetical protein